MTSNGAVSVHVEGVPLVIGRIGLIETGSAETTATAINVGLKIVEAAAKTKVHKKTSNLARSIHTINASAAKLEGKVVTEEQYAASIEKGAQPHVIVPINALALHFEMGGEDVFATSVQHPGNEPYPFMEPALMEHKADILGSIMLGLQMEFAKL